MADQKASDDWHNRRERSVAILEWGQEWWSNHRAWWEVLLLVPRRAEENPVGRWRSMSFRFLEGKPIPFEGSHFSSPETFTTNLSSQVHQSKVWRRHQGWFAGGKSSDRLLLHALPFQWQKIGDFLLCNPRTSKIHSFSTHWQATIIIKQRWWCDPIQTSRTLAHGNSSCFDNTFPLGNQKKYNNFSTPREKTQEFPWTFLEITQRISLNKKHVTFRLLSVWWSLTSKRSLLGTQISLGTKRRGRKHDAFTKTPSSVSWCFSFYCPSTPLVLQFGFCKQYAEARFYPSQESTTFQAHTIFCQLDRLITLAARTQVTYVNRVLAFIFATDDSFAAWPSASMLGKPILGSTSTWQSRD